jgi:hypothetical protein
MDVPNKPAPARRGRGMAGGSLLALSMVAGVVTGTLYGQPSVGFLGGLSSGRRAVRAAGLAARPEELGAPRQPPRRQRPAGDHCEPSDRRHHAEPARAGQR